jgi:type VI secretion system secreted protein VgrG
MGLVSKIDIEIDGESDKLKNFLNLTINQNIYYQNEFQVAYRMDAFEEENNFIMEKSRKYLGSVIKITIEAAEDGQSKSSDMLFKGIITSVRSAKSDTGETDNIILSGHSPDILLSDNPGCCSFENKTLQQIVDDILRPYPKDVLKLKNSPAKSDTLTYIVQYNESRYDFLRRLATRYGEWFYYDGSQLIFGKLPDTTIDLTLGLDLKYFDFCLRMNPLNFKYVAYDVTSAKAIDTSSSNSGGKDNLNKYGKEAHEKSMKNYGQRSTRFYAALNVPDNNISKELGQAVSLEEGALALSMSVIRGSSQNIQLKPGCKVNVKALKSGDSGTVDYGEYIITSMNYSCDNGMNYQNNFEGIPSEAKIPDYTNPDSLPYCDVQSAIVKDNNDPDKQGRVRVNFFWQDSNMMSPWLRVVNTYSGADAGFYFVPETGDEVLVGFEGGNAEKPYIIGSMYHGKNKPKASWPEKDNSFKGIITKSKLLIEFDDKKKITTIATPGGNKAVLSDDGKSILLQDQNQNKIEMTSGGIVMESVKNIKITSKSKITIEGTAGVDISSPADAKLSGMNIDLDANVSLKAKGNVTAELSATGQTTVKGAMVMIN